MSKQDTFGVKQREDLMRVLGLGKLNIVALCRLTGTVHRDSVHDWRRGKSPLKDDDLLAMRKTVNTIRIEVKKVLTEFERRATSEVAVKLFEVLYARDEVVWNVFFDRSKDLRNKLNGWKMNRRSFPVDEVPLIRTHFLVFLTETTL